jgi:hypothetical protein
MSSTSGIELDRARFRGALLGLAAGDALGTTVEFEPPGAFEPVVDMVGGGPVAPGEFTWFAGRAPSSSSGRRLFTWARICSAESRHANPTLESSFSE